MNEDPPVEPPLMLQDEEGYERPEPPPPGKIDLDRARYWAGRGPQGGERGRKQRFPYSKT